MLVGDLDTATPGPFSGPAFESWHVANVWGVGTSPTAVQLGDGSIVGMVAKNGEDPLSGASLVVVASGKRTDLADGVSSFAVRSDGAVAYAKATAGSSKSSIILVDDGEGTQEWLAVPDFYVVTGWAGEVLLVQRAQGDSGIGSMLAVTAPNNASEILPQGYVGAVSPDGDTLLATSFIDDGPSVRLIDPTGLLVAEIDAGDRGITGATWAGDTIAVTTLNLAIGGSGIGVIDLTKPELTIVDFDIDPSLSPTWSAPVILSDGRIVAIGSNGTIPNQAGEIPSQPYLVAVCTADTCEVTPISSTGFVDIVRKVGPN